MSGKRKPKVKPIANATEAVIWRSRIMMEMLEGMDLPPQFKEPMKRWQDSLEDFEVSRNPVNGNAQLELGHGQ